MFTKKLLLDARMIHSSGIGTYIKSLITDIKDKFDLVLLGREEELRTFVSADKIIPFSAPVYSIREQLMVFRMCRADLFWSPHYNVPLFPLGYGKRVVTIHDVFHLAHYDQLSCSQKAYSTLMLSAAVRLSDAVITVSEFSKREIIKYTSCPERKIRVIHNGVRTQGILKDEKDIRTKYRLPDKYILFVGNVKPHKNIRKLLKAYLLLETRLQKEYKIVIVGKKGGFITADHHLIDWINATPALSENVHFTGYVEDDDMDSLYSFASLFVFPSVYEGFGLPPLEAMLNHCPVVASNSTSIPEVCGDAALYFDPLNETDICARIRLLLMDKPTRDSLIAKGTRRLKEFNWKQSAYEHTEVFDMLLD